MSEGLCWPHHACGAGIWRLLFFFTYLVREAVSYKHHGDVTNPTVIPSHQYDVAIASPSAPAIQIAAAALIPFTSKPLLKMTAPPRNPMLERKP